MSTTQQPEALRLADALERPGYGWHSTPAQCAAELRRLRAENETLQQGYAAARLEIESLRARSAEPAGEYPALPKFKAGAVATDASGKVEMYPAAFKQLLSEIFDRGAREAAGAWRAYVDADRAMRAAQPAGAQQPGATHAALPTLFREALAWGMTYGPEIPAHQWDEMRESMVKQYTDRAMGAQAAPAAPPVPSGWSFDVKRSDGRVWLTISTPHGASATLSAAEKTGNGDDTIVAQVLDYLADSLAVPAAVAGPSGPSITLDFKMASELLDMFGGEPGLVTLQHGGEKCHSGVGLYAWYSDLPEEGAGFLGAEPDDEAAPTTQPAPQQEAQEPATVPYQKLTNEIDLILSDPDTELSIGAKRALLWMRTWVSVPLYTAPQPSPASQGDAQIAPADVLLRTAIAETLYRQVRIEHDNRIGPWSAFDVREQQRIVDSIQGLCSVFAPASQGDSLSQAARDVLAERQRQIRAEGWTPEHDDEHLPGELALAAASYVCADEGDAPPAIWPWDWSWWKPGARRRNLVKSGALILAELERMDRADAARAAQEGKSRGN